MPPRTRQSVEHLVDPGAGPTSLGEQLLPDDVMGQEQELARLAPWRHNSDALRAQVAALATATATHLGLEPLPIIDKVLVNDDYLGQGYAKVGELEREAIQLVAQREGILLDPVYTGRAMGGLIDLIRWGAFTRGQTVLFWHTGGTAALPAFAEKIL